MGRQPFGLASPAAWLRARRVGRGVRRRGEGEAAGGRASQRPTSIGFHLPMHTATRLAAPIIATRPAREPGGAHLRVRAVCAAERRVAAIARRRRGVRRRVRRGAGRVARIDVRGTQSSQSTQSEPSSSASSAVSAFDRRPLPKIHFLVPDRSGLPPLSTLRDAADARRRRRAARRLHRSQPRLPASVPALSGRADLQRTVPRRAAGRRARRRRRADRGGRASTSRSAIPISSTVRRTRMRIVDALHAAHPAVSYDVTIKVEHLLRHRDLLPRLARHRLRVRDERRRIARRSRARAARQGAHARRLRRRRRAVPREPA